MNNAASRNLYKLTNLKGQFLGHITAENSMGATGTYRDITGFRGELRAEQISHGYPEIVVQIAR